ncbi:hypothetical protein RchiOBHm_Chr7g0182911 [Rosa chinensis]|uniref:Uncharacterized protein n=1 Tax=Rosa chinensis TaxID=74649 RepID=A0A2P6P313_ROSCH|nr:hypothetical protein RchiOBHm_Chr7g0182911 [Rosa chinensis]
MKLKSGIGEHDSKTNLPNRLIPLIDKSIIIKISNSNPNKFNHEPNQPNLTIRFAIRLHLWRHEELLDWDLELGIALREARWMGSEIEREDLGEEKSVEMNMGLALLGVWILRSE